MMDNKGNWVEIKFFDSSPQAILKRRQTGIIYKADFNNSYGQYISSQFDSSDPIDAIIQVTPRIEVRITYIIKHEKIEGLQITKLNKSGKADILNLSTFDWEGILKLLHIFSVVDLKSIASGSLLLDRSLISDQKLLTQFLTTVATDPEGSIKLAEVAESFNLLKPGEVKNIAYRNSQISLMDDLLNKPGCFDQYQKKLSIGKPEEVWQRFFSSNSWILGSEIVEVLPERDIDEDHIADLPVEGYDGFLDVIELKLPGSTIWNTDISLSSSIMKPIMQCMNYVVSYEKKMNDHDKLGKLNVDILKPRISLIIGRSNTWTNTHKAQFRILNSSFHNLSILTYDHVLQRAKRITNYDTSI